MSEGNSSDRRNTPRGKERRSPTRVGGTSVDISHAVKRVQAALSSNPPRIRRAPPTLPLARGAAQLPQLPAPPDEAPQD